MPTQAAKYHLIATATSKTGLVISSDSNKFVPIQVDFASSITSVSLTSNLYGLNSQQELINFINSNDPARL